MKMHAVEKRILLGVLVCFFVSIIGVSFAYFTSSNKMVGNGATGDWVTSDLINVEYDAGTTILNLENAYPGKSVSKSFSVAVTPGNYTNSVTYAIVLNISENTFVKCSDNNYDDITNACIIDAEELIYTVKDKDGKTVASGDLLDKTGEVVLATITSTVNSEEVFKYSLEISFVDVNADQNHNANKSLNANLEVVFAK